jgi:hypothetical protein
VVHRDIKLDQVIAAAPTDAHGTCEQRHLGRSPWPPRMQ